MDNDPWRMLNIMYHANCHPVYKDKLCCIVQDFWYNKNVVKAAQDEYTFLKILQVTSHTWNELRIILDLSAAQAPTGALEQFEPTVDAVDSSDKKIDRGMVNDDELALRSHVEKCTMLNQDWQAHVKEFVYSSTPRNDDAHQEFTGTPPYDLCVFDPSRVSEFRTWMHLLNTFSKVRKTDLALSNLFLTCAPMWNASSIAKRSMRTGYRREKKIQWKQSIMCR